MLDCVSCTFILCVHVIDFIDFFRVPDERAKSGKRWVSLLGGMGMVTATVSMLSRPTHDWSWYTPPLALFAYALWLFWRSYLINRTRPLSFAFANEQPHHLMRVGPYQKIRHPFYASYIAGWIASFLAGPNIATALVMVCMTSLYYRAARKEETAFLSSPLQQQYREYQARGSMFLPLR